MYWTWVGILWSLSMAIAPAIGAFWGLHQIIGSGRRGEADARALIEASGHPARHDVLLPLGNHLTQIDHLVQLPDRIR